MTWDPSMRAPESRLDRPDELLAAFGNPVAPEVLRVLRDGGAPRVGDIAIEFDELRHKHRVYRVRAAADGWARSLIVKRLDPDAAQRNGGFPALAEIDAWFQAPEPAIPQ